MTLNLLSFRNFQRITFRILARNRFKHYDKFKAHDTLPKSKLLEIQEQRLRSLLKYVKKTVPYYQEVFLKNCIDINASDIHSEIRKIPVTDKLIINKRFEDMKSTDYKEKSYNIAYTSGSTVNPLKIINYSEDYERLIGIFYRNHSWTGFNPWTKSLWIWTTHPSNNIKGFFKRIKHLFIEFLLNRRYIHSMDISDIKLRDWIKIIENGDFKVIYCHGGSTRYFIEKLDEWEIKLSTNLKSIYYSASELDNRNKMEKIFKVPVYNQYGMTEILSVAEECSHKNMHIAIDSVYLELIPVKGTNFGEIVITSLERYGFPLIRYKTGDIAFLNKERCCDCGLSYPIMDFLPTRTFGTLINKNGEMVTPLIANKISELLIQDKIRQFQPVQNTKQELLFKITSNGREISEITKVKLIELIDRKLNIDSAIKYEKVTELPRTKEGKYWIIRNQLLD